MHEIQACRSDFPSLQRSHNGHELAFLDGPGGTQAPRVVIDAVTEYFLRFNSNIHGNFIVSEESDAIIRKCREHLAVLLNASSWQSISVGPNMTSLNLALSRAFGNLLRPGDEIVITELDHEANRGPWLNLQKRGIIVQQVPLRQDGTLDSVGMERRINGNTKLLAIGYSSNALGTVNDIRHARKISAEVGAYLLIDAVHYAPHFCIDVQDIDCDFLLCSAYKFYGPHVGILYSRPGLLEQLPVEKISSQDDSAPYRIESGTQNHEGLNGTIAAIDYIASFGKGKGLRARLVDAMKRFEIYEYGLARRAYDELHSMDHVTVFGEPFDGRPRAPTIAFVVHGVPSDVVARHLGANGLLVWDGDFAAGRAIEVLDTVRCNGVVRIGISIYNTMEEIERLVSAVREMDRKEVK